MNLEFSFKIGCHTKVQEPNLPYYLSIAGRRLDSYLFQGYESTMWNRNSFAQVLNWFRCVHFVFIWIFTYLLGSYFDCVFDHSHVISFAPTSLLSDALSQLRRDKFVLCVCIYIYICVCVCVCVCMYTIVT